MTGYGRGEVTNHSLSCTIEMKSVNNRYCDIQIRLPKMLFALEEEIRKECKKKIFRGKVDIFITCQFLQEDSISLAVDELLLGKYIDQLQDLQRKYHLEGQLDINKVLDLEGVWRLQEKDVEVEEIRESFLEALHSALDALVDMRTKEGESLKRDLMEKMNAFIPHEKFLREQAPVLLEQNKEEFLHRFHLMADSEEYDMPRLTSELIIMSDKLSIDEEITRITSHISQFNDIINRNDPVGRKLDFLLQELHREVNTIGSKTSDLVVINHVVEMKSIIEQLREQVQNIE